LDDILHIGPERYEETKKGHKTTDRWNLSNLIVEKTQKLALSREKTMKRIIMLTLLLAMMLVSIGGCLIGLNEEGRGRDGWHDRDGRHDRDGDHDRDQRHEEQR